MFNTHQVGLVTHNLLQSRIKGLSDESISPKAHLLWRNQNSQQSRHHTPLWLMKSHVDLMDAYTLKIESIDPVEKTIGIEGDINRISFKDHWTVMEWDPN